MSRQSSQKVNSELFSLEPTTLLEFFVIYYDYVNLPDEKLYIHGGTNGINKSIYWQGEEYLPFPIQSSGFESKGDGTLPRPKLAVSNQDFFMSNLIRRYNNLIGAKVVRKRTFVKFLDNQNFSENKNPYGTADASSGLEDQIFFIQRRTAENRELVEFELASPLEIDGVLFPRRTVMSRYCGFHYRGNGCRYMGIPVADENDMKFTLPAELVRDSLIRRKYDRAQGSSVLPTSTALFTSEIAAATFKTATFSASISGTSLVVYSVSSGEIAVGMTLFGNANIPVGLSAPIITASLGVIGGHQTYQLNTSLTVSTSTIKGTYERLVSSFTPEAQDNYYYEFFGFFKVDYGEGGTYQFQLASDDCAELFINGQPVCREYAANLGSAVTASITLVEGFHKILVRFFEANGMGGNQSISLQYKVPNGASFVNIPATRLYYDPQELSLLTVSQRAYSSLNVGRSISLSKDQILEQNFLSKWVDGKTYSSGDYVYIENSNVKVSKRDSNANPNWEPLQKFYLCVKAHTSSASRHPSVNKEYWIADQCSKTIDGCKLRFGRDAHLPFGGFPGTEEYSIGGQ